MKILFLSTTFPDAASPSRGTYNAALCRSLLRGHEVRVISPRMFTEVHRPFRRGQRYETPTGFASLGVQVDYPTYWYTPRMLQHCYGDHMWWSIRHVVERALEDFQPDAVLSYWAHPDGEVGVRAAQRAGAPSAVIIGGTDVLLLPHEPRRGERIRDVLVQSDAVIAVSEGLRQAALRLKVSAGRVHTIYQGIDPAIFHSRGRDDSRRKLGLASDVAHLLWVGRMAEVKGLDVLAQAAAELKSRGRKFQLHLLGNGPELPSLRDRVRDLSLTAEIHFAGAVPPETVADWHRAADLSVLSSHSEGLPNVLRESLACGTPFVSTDVGSIREIAQPEFSTLVPPRDPLALADAIERTLAPGFRERAAQRQPRTWDDCAADVAALLTSLRQANLTKKTATSPSVLPAQRYASLSFPAKLCCDIFPEDLRRDGLSTYPR